MIKITVELVSAVHPSRSRLLGVATIANTGTGTAQHGNYTCSLLNKRGRVYSSGNVQGHPRLAVSFWRLVHKAIGAAISKETR